MPNSLYWEIVGHLRAHLLGIESLDAFEDWFVARSWNIHQSGDQPSIDLVSEIELHLAEFSSGHWSEAELEKFFLAKVVAALPMNIDTGTHSATEHQVVKIPLAMASRSLTEHIESPMVNV